MRRTQHPVPRSPRRPHWLADDEWRALREPRHRPEPRHVVAALRHALLQARTAQDHESRCAAAHVLGVLVQVGTGAVAPSREWERLTAEVRAVQREHEGEALPGWWPARLSHERARTLLTLVREMETRGVATLALMRQAMIDEMFDRSATDGYLPTIGEVLTGHRQRRGPRAQRKGDTDGLGRTPAGEPPTSSAA